MQNDILVSYDVSTLEAEGRARLRRVAKACENWGQRVQHSVFECSVSDMVYERLKKKLLSIINPEEDSLRIYHLRGKRGEYLEAFGLDRYMDFGDALVV